MRISDWRSDVCSSDLADDLLSHSFSASLLSCRGAAPQGFGDASHDARVSLVGSDLLDLGELQVDRGRSSEDRHRHLQARLLLVHVLDVAVEGRERAVRDAHLLADLEGDGRLRPIHALGDLLDATRALALGARGRIALAAQATCSIRWEEGNGGEE